MVLQFVLPALGVGTAIALALGFGIPLLALVSFIFVHPYILLFMIVGVVAALYLFKK